MSRWFPSSLGARLGFLSAVVLVAGVAVLQGYLEGRVGWDVRVGSVALGGLTRQQAVNRLQQGLAQSSLLSAQFQTPRGARTMGLDQLGLSIDVAATVKAAENAGRTAPIGGLSLWVMPGAQVAPVVRVDTAKFQSGLEALSAAVAVPARDARLGLRGRRVVVTPSREGSDIDTVALERAVLASLARWQPYLGPVPMSVVAPHIDTATAQQRAAQARVYFERPLTLRYRSRSIVLSAEQMAAMLTVNAGNDAGEPPLTFDNTTARRMLHKLFAFVEVPVRDATVRISGGAVTVVPSRSGIELDMPRLLGDMDAVVASNGLRVVYVALRVVQPALTTADVQEMGLSALGSQFSTFFDPSNIARATNIAQAAKIVDGTIVRPGEVFSLNAVLGPRTVNRGFDYAPVIAGDGVLRLGVGGGICQYATTLFNAVFFAGLPVVERHAHSLYIDHYPIGRDATVAWGGPDFKFKNDTGRPLMIRSWTSNGVLTVVVVGKTGRTVSFTTSSFYDVRAPRTSKDHPRVIYDSDLSAGIVRWEKGWAGRSVKVVRTVRQGGAILFTDTFVSVYQPADWIKRIGTR